MKVFSIKGKFQQNGRYSELPADFKGYFVLEESGHIKGYMEEQYQTLYDKERYIYGRYDEEKKILVYLKMSTEHKLSPLLYCFPNLEDVGVWSAYSCELETFNFLLGFAEGCTTVTIKENTTMSSDEILDKYQKVIDDDWDINMTLIKYGVVDDLLEIFSKK
jgi:hypothetical protein